MKGMKREQRGEELKLKAMCRMFVQVMDREFDCPPRG
jgi:hypothetical protein